MENIKITLLAVIISTAVFAGKKNSGPQPFDTSKDFDVAGKSILKKSETAAITKLALHFKTISKASESVGKGQNKTYATAYAILEGVEEQVFQEITDEFAQSFSKKLEGLGISMIGWDKVKATENFEKMKAKQIDREFKSNTTGFEEIYTANNGPYTKQVVGNPGIWGTYAKIGKELGKGTNTIALDIIIDFASFDIDLKRKYSAYYTNTSASANGFPMISVMTNNGAPGLGYMTTNMTTVGKYGEATIITPKKNVLFDDTKGEYAVEVSSYQGKLPERMKQRFTFGDNMTTGTFVIKADAAKYKEAVLGALNKYADFLIENIKTEVRG